MIDFLILLKSFKVKEFFGVFKMNVFYFDETKKDIHDKNLIAGWDHRVHDVIKYWMNKKFHIGTANCFTFCGMIQTALTGKTQITEANIIPTDNEKVALFLLKKRIKEITNGNDHNDIRSIMDKLLKPFDRSYHNVSLVGRPVDVHSVGNMSVGYRRNNECLFLSENGLSKDKLKDTDILWSP